SEIISSRARSISVRYAIPFLSPGATSECSQTAVLLRRFGGRRQRAAPVARRARNSELRDIVNSERGDWTSHANWIDLWQFARRIASLCWVGGSGICGPMLRF